MTSRASSVLEESGIRPSDSASNVPAIGKAKREAEKKKDGFFDPMVALRKGKCGYQHCGKALDKNGVDDEDAISCAKHHETWYTGYRYDSETDSQIKFGSNLDYQNCFNNGHAALHSNIDKDFSSGKLSTGFGGYGNAERTYGAWTQSVPMETIWLIQIYI